VATDAQSDVDIDFRQHREFTVLRRVGDRWEPVGLSGDLALVKGEMTEWRHRLGQRAVLVYGQREVGPWTLGDEAP